MKKLFFLGLLIVNSFTSFSQCTLNNATDCLCNDGTQICDLLPDITISWYALSTYSGGPTEYSQAGNGANDGKIRVTGSTPNIGLGPLVVEGQDANSMAKYLCGTDTFTALASDPFTCPNGETAKKFLYQRIYHKNTGIMSFWERLIGPFTYNAGTMYIDEWGKMSLRYEVAGITDPRDWPIVGSGTKTAFCLMDYGSCSTYNGHCRDDQSVYNQGNILVNADFPNWGLGNGYGCSTIEQGIASGYTDIYSENLNGMWINIPPGTCNGDYWIVYEIDPNNYFLEENDLNNYCAVPITLTLQDAPGNAVATIVSDSDPTICGNDSVTLTASAGFNFIWSTGQTSQIIKAGPGSYSCTVTNHCGTASSTPFIVTSLPTPNDPVATDDTACVGTSATLTSTGNNLSWFDLNNSVVGLGNTFTTPPLSASETYYVQDISNISGDIKFVGKTDSSGGGSYFTGNQSLIFDALMSLTLKSVKVYAHTAGQRTIEMKDAGGTVIHGQAYNMTVGEQIVNLNYFVPAGNSYSLGINGNSDLYRNNAAVSFPYTVTDTFSITGTTAGTAFYYFFYDWKIEIGGHTCSSLKIPVTATAKICDGIAPEVDLTNNFIVKPIPSNGVFDLSMVVPSSSDFLISVFDVSGRKIYNENLHNISGKYFTTLNLKEASKGVYLLAIEIGGRRYFKKLVIE